MFVDGPRHLLDKPYYFSLSIEVTIKFIIVLFIFYQLFLKVSRLIISALITIGLLLSNILHNLFLPNYVNNGGGIYMTLVGYIIGMSIFFILFIFTFSVFHFFKHKNRIK